MERPVNARVTGIRAAEYQPSFQHLEHVFLAGDLRKPCPHPFFRETRLEIVACQYGAGAHVLFHWHSQITEYEYVLEGAVSYVEAQTGRTEIFRAGDLATVPAGVCVRRLIHEPCRTLAVKTPSSDEKIHCRDCDRVCASRVEPFGGRP